MGKIDVNLLEAGMELEDDAREAKGLVLLPAGTVITEKHIGILKSWDVPEVAVKGATQGICSGVRRRKWTRRSGRRFPNSWRRSFATRTVRIRRHRRFSVTA